MRLIIICLLASIFAISCDEPTWNSPTETGTKPAPVSTYTVKNYSGGAVIKYKIPDQNTAYIMAKYEINPGQVRESKASQFVDSIIVDGFEKAGTYDVILYAVGVDEQKSEPLKITVNPGTPSYREAFSTLTAEAGFGGVVVRASNPQGDNLVIETMVKNSLGNWEIYNRYYTNNPIIKFNIRGLSDQSTDFGFYVRDRWAHYSDTLYTSLTPLKESILTFKPYVNIKLPTDAGLLAANYSIDKLFDGKYGEPDLLTARESGIPHHITISLQNTYRLSRLKLFQRQGKASEPSRLYNSLNPRRFRIWGSMAPNPNGAFDSSWTLLGEFEGVKPSGLPLGQLTAEDITRALEGEDFEFDSPTPEVRYLRFQLLETWGQANYMHMAELEIWGIKVD